MGDFCLHYNQKRNFRDRHRMSGAKNQLFPQEAPFGKKFQRNCEGTVAGLMRGSNVIQLIRQSYLDRDAFQD